MKYIAYAMNKETRENVILKNEYPSKKKFAEDIRNNGYAVRFISTEENFDADSDKYHWKCEKRNRINKYVRQAMKD